jgi:parvulin-like peptidyl-prolyl isomerase
MSKNSVADLIENCNKMRKIVPIALLIFIALVACSRNSGEDNIVARVGKQKITMDEFRKSFALNPRYAVRTPMREARDSQLDFLINQKNYYQAAKKVHLENDPEIQDRLNYIRDHETIRAYLQKYFISRIELSPQEIQQALQNLNKTVRVQHLFVENRQQALSLEERLKNGEKFNDLAREIYKDADLKNNGGDLGYVGFGDMDPALEQWAFSARPGDISPPLQSAYGYHIMKVTDIRPAEQAAELGTTMKLQLVTDILKNRKGDNLIREHLKELSGNRKVQINNKVLDRLVESTRQVMGDRYDKPDIFKPAIHTGDLNLIESNLERISNQTLLIFGQRQMTVEDFLERIKQMPPLHRPYLKTRNRMEQTIIDLVRDDLLLEKAREKGITEDLPKSEAYRHIIEDFLANEFENRYYSDYFKQENPAQWQAYSQALRDVKANNAVTVYPERLFADVEYPDSIMAPDPIPLFIQNRYIW